MEKSIVFDCLRNISSPFTYISSFKKVSIPLQIVVVPPAVVLDSAILGVLPASSELLGGRRVLPPHAHEQPANPYAPMPVDPLVVNFEEGMRLY